MIAFAGVLAVGFVFFIAMVIWAAVRVAKLSGTSTKVDELAREVERLRDRLVLVEKRSVQDAAEAPSGAQQTMPTRAAEWEDERTLRPRSKAVTKAPTSSPLRQPPPISVIPPTPIPNAVAPQVASTVASPAALVSELSVVAARVRNEPISRVADVLRTANPSVASESEPMLVKRSISLEERLGQNWLNKLGIVILVTGLASLLGYQLRTLGPVGKSTIGLVLSSVILVAGVVLEKQDRYRVFARAAIGGGWALLYFVTFGLFHVPAMQVLHSQAIDLVLMLVVASAMVLHSLRYRSQVVTSLAFLLGFFTVSISHVTIFSLIASAILAVGLVVVAFREHWFVMALGGLVGVYVNHFLWLHRVLPDGAKPGHPFPEFLPSAALLLCYWLMFRMFYIFRIPETQKDRVCSTLNVLLNSVGLLSLLKYQSSHPEWAFRGLVALGVAELVLAFVARRRHHNAFVALICIASIFLVAAVPFRFAGTNWSLTWLLEAEVLFITGLALRETVFRRLGVLAAFAAVGHMLADGAAPVFDLRQSQPDASHHAVLALAFGCAALVAWFDAEFVTRRWTDLVGDELDRRALRALSYAGAACAAVGAWLALAGPWTLLPWLAFAPALAFASTRLRSVDLAQQADVLCVAALARAAVINFQLWSRFDSAPRTVILLIACGLLYACMRRRQSAYVLPEKAIEPAYAWAAGAMLTCLAWYALQPAAVSVAWCVLGAVLLELGIVTRKAFFRQQGLVLLVFSFVRLFFINVSLASKPRLYTMLPLMLVYAWVYQRLFSSERSERADRVGGTVSAWFALGTTATLLYFSLRPEWVAIGGAALAVGVLLLARVLRRPLFLVQGLTLIVVVAARTLAFNVASTEALSVKFMEGRVFTVSVACALLFAALPIAFSLRKQTLEPEGLPAWLRVIVARPEQIVFFAPFVVLFGFIPAQLRAGMITVGWSALGVAIFLFALTVGERSFRLAGLVVLLVGVAKILGVDIWNASPTDRYITLIVMGAALLLVSFLYSQYREKILELL